MSYKMILLKRKRKRFVCMLRNNIYLCGIKIKKNGMNQNFIYILLCGIIILLAMFSGSGYCA
ncbi:hypothetical protein C3V43_06855 [Bacteroides heparinolyticus]|nr:hypothetical protein C3V43_06855 [Bacteroides heparinolyticus]